MLRRRLFAYTVMTVAGVTAGYLFFECNKYLYSGILMLSLALAVRVADLEYIPEYCDRERIKLIAFLFIGYMLFSFSYIQFNGAIHYDGSTVNEDDVGSISGRVTAVAVKDDALQVTVRPNNYKGMMKVQASYYQDNFTTDILGERIIMYGELRKPAGAENPGCFNYRTYLYSKGIRYTFNAKYIEIDEHAESAIVNLYWHYRRTALNIREDFLGNFDNDTSGFIKGVVFGDKSEIDKQTLDEFNANSTGHILAVSGLHIGFLFALLIFLTRNRKGKGITALIIVIIIFYGEMTGWSPSTSRSVLVLSISMISIYLRRSPDLLTSVSCAAMILIIRNPYVLFNSGFQLSFLALLGISFLTEPLSHYVGDYLSMLLAVQLTVAPMLAYTFLTFNISAILINIPVVFMASILVPICILSISLMLLSGLIPEVAIVLITNISELIIRINSCLNFDDLLVRDVKGISIFMLVVYYIAVFLACSEWTRIRMLRNDINGIYKAVISLIIPVLCIGLATFNQFNNDEIVFVNVGQGDCIHIKSDGNNVLIDGGGNAYYNVGERILRPYLLHNNADELELALITHQHSDHYKGLEELSEIFPMGSIMQLEVGEKIHLSENVTIEAIWPVQRYKNDMMTEDENENNTVYLIQYEGIKTMVTGDLTEEDELAMVERYRGTDVLNCDILKVAHHGSNTSSCEEFLDAVQPQIAVIQVGANNSYGHPHQETLDRLQARNIATYRTDINGAVGIDVKGYGPPNSLERGPSPLTRPSPRIKVDTMR